jgi:hypothetical protein
MKKSSWPFVYLALLLFIFLLLPGLIHAQGPGDPGPGDPGCDPDVICPIDSGLISLIAVGVGYGIKKLIDHRKVEPVS